MDYLQQLKALKREKKSEIPLEHTLQNLRNPEKGSFVGFVASPLGVSANFSAASQTDADSNDPPPVSPHAARVAELAGAAYLHHFACKHCQAAGRGLSFAYMRCDTGRELWEAYQDAIE